MANTDNFSSLPKTLYHDGTTLLPLYLAPLARFGTVDETSGPDEDLAALARGSPHG